MDVRRVEIYIEANDPGTVFDVAKRLKEKWLPGRPRVVPDRERRVVTVEGASLEDVDRGMKRYVAAYGKGHGGYRFKYSTEEIVVSESETVEAEVAARFEREIEGLKRERAAHEEKWAVERKAHKDRFQDLEGTLAQERLHLEDAREIARARLEELIDARNEISGLRRRFEELQGQVDRLERRPLGDILWSRLRRLFHRNRNA